MVKNKYFGLSQINVVVDCDTKILLKKEKNLAGFEPGQCSYELKRQPPYLTGS